MGSSLFLVYLRKKKVDPLDTIVVKYIALAFFASMCDALIRILPILNMFNVIVVPKTAKSNVFTMTDR